MKNHCAVCAMSFYGRPDKKFCSPACKNAFHASTLNQLNALYRETESILRKNHKILQNLQLGSKTELVERAYFTRSGFKFDHCTGIFTNAKGEQFFLLYNFAWREMENDSVLVVKK